jgi:hypothetical protein
MITLADMEGHETYEPSMLGHAEEARTDLPCISPVSPRYLPGISLTLALTLTLHRQVIEERICDDDHLVIKGGKTRTLPLLPLLLLTPTPTPHPHPGPHPGPRPAQVIKGGKTPRSCCCLLRGANMHMLDEVRR